MKSCHLSGLDQVLDDLDKHMLAITKQREAVERSRAKEVRRLMRLIALGKHFNLSQNSCPWGSTGALILEGNVYSVFELMEEIETIRFMRKATRADLLKIVRS